MKSPTTLTARAAGAHTAKAVPVTLSCSRDVRAEPVVELLVAALADQVLVEFADRGQERVRIVDRELAGVAVVDLEPVAQRQLGALDHALEHAAGMDLLELDRLPPSMSAVTRAGRRAERADDHAAVLRVRPKHGVGI